MTRDQWNQCQSPQEMLAWLRREGRVSDRKGRLFAAACCRLVWGALTHARDRQAVEVAERYADGQATEKERRVTHAAAGKRRTASFMAGGALGDYQDVVGFETKREGPVSGEFAAQVAVYYLTEAAKAADLDAAAAKWNACDLLRDIFNPFQPGTPVSPWRSESVLNLAAASYEERSLPSGHLEPTRLALLADSLEDARCDDAELLGHLRGTGPHYRGCWGLDVVLSKT